MNRYDLRDDDSGGRCSMEQSADGLYVEYDAHLAALASAQRRAEAAEAERDALRAALKDVVYVCRGIAPGSSAHNADGATTVDVEDALHAADRALLAQEPDARQ